MGPCPRCRAPLSLVEGEAGVGVWVGDEEGRVQLQLQEQHRQQQLLGVVRRPPLHPHLPSSPSFPLNRSLKFSSRSLGWRLTPRRPSAAQRRQRRCVLFALLAARYATSYLPSKRGATSRHGLPLSPNYCVWMHRQLLRGLEA